MAGFPAQKGRKWGPGKPEKSEISVDDCRPVALGVVVGEWGVGGKTSVRIAWFSLEPRLGPIVGRSQHRMNFKLHEILPLSDPGVQIFTRW